MTNLAATRWRVYCYVNPMLYAISASLLVAPSCMDRVSTENERPSVSPEASCEHDRAAPRTGTSSISCVVSSRKHGRPHDGSYPRQKRNVGPRHSCPRRTSPVAPLPSRKGQLNQWPVITPPRGSTSAAAPLADFLAAAYNAKGEEVSRDGVDSCRPASVGACPAINKEGPRAL